MLVGLPHFPHGAGGPPERRAPGRASRRRPTPTLLKESAAGLRNRPEKIRGRAAHSSRGDRVGFGCPRRDSGERVRHRCVPRETARPCGRRTSAGDGAGFVGLPHDPHRAGGPPRAFRLLSRPAAYHPGRDPSLAGPSENELWGSAEACWVARGVGGPEREESRPGLGGTWGCSEGRKRRPGRIPARPRISLVS